VENHGRGKRERESKREKEKKGRVNGGYRNGRKDR
jgi:hypothetical protein